MTIRFIVARIKTRHRHNYQEVQNFPFENPPAFCIICDRTKGLIDRKVYPTRQMYETGAR